MQETCEEPRVQGISLLCDYASDPESEIRPPGTDQQTEQQSDIPVEISQPNQAEEHVTGTAETTLPPSSSTQSKSEIQPTKSTDHGKEGKEAKIPFALSESSEMLADKQKELKTAEASKLTVSGEQLVLSTPIIAQIENQAEKIDTEEVGAKDTVQLPEAEKADAERLQKSIGQQLLQDLESADEARNDMAIDDIIKDSQSTKSPENQKEELILRDSATPETADAAKKSPLLTAALFDFPDDDSDKIISDSQSTDSPILPSSQEDRTAEQILPSPPKLAPIVAASQTKSFQIEANTEAKEITLKATTTALPEVIATMQADEPEAHNARPEPTTVESNLSGLPEIAEQDPTQPEAEVSPQAALELEELATQMPFSENPRSQPDDPNEASAKISFADTANGGIGPASSENQIDTNGAYSEGQQDPPAKVKDINEISQAQATLPEKAKARPASTANPNDEEMQLNALQAAYKIRSKPNKLENNQESLEKGRARKNHNPPAEPKRGRGRSKSRGRGEGSGRSKGKAPAEIPQKEVWHELFSLCTQSSLLHYIFSMLVKGFFFHSQTNHNQLLDFGMTKFCLFDCRGIFKYRRFCGP